MKPQAKGGKMNYEDYDPAENKNNIPEMPAIKEQNQQTINPQTQQNTNPTTNVVKKEIQISQQTKERADACKLFIERKYTKLKQDEKEKKEDWEMLIKRMENMQLSSSEKEIIKHDIIQKESELMRKKRLKISSKNFDSLAIIGRGAFGEVRLCRSKDTGEVVAIKKMKKSEMLFKNQVGHVRAERDVLVNSNLPWIVDLLCSFQDEKYLYLVMEYLPGGDLMTYLMKKDILSEEEAKFYIAECILAVDAVHKMNYIHRDLKPDNILLDANGHIKLSDFGLCKRAEIRPRLDFGKKKENEDLNSKLTNLDFIKKQQTPYKRNRQLAFSTVGTPDYIAPEVFIQGGYNETVDWWSLGVILFEMLVGYPPFFSEDPSSTCQKILQWKKTFGIPPEPKLSPSSIDLIRRLIADSNERLGINGVEEIKAHPFFFGVDWKKIREKKAPYLPEVKSEIDTCNFDKFEEEEPWLVEDKQKKGKKANRQQDIEFIGYTFKKDVENQRSHLKLALENLEENMLTQGKKTNLADFGRRGSDPLLPSTKVEEEKEINYIKAQENIPPPKFQENFAPNQIPPKQMIISNNSFIKEPEKSVISKEKIITPPPPSFDKPNTKPVLNPKLQALFARSNSPKDNPTTQTNTIQNTNALLNKLNLPPNVMKFVNNKEENNVFANKGSPKASGNTNQTIKLQDQIKQLQQEQMFLQKKIPQIYQNVVNEPKNNTKPAMNYNFANKFNPNKDNETSIPTKNNFGDSGSPKGPNSKPNFLLNDKNLKNQGIETNFFKGKLNEMGASQQNSTNLYQNFANQKNKK